MYDWTTTGAFALGCVTIWYIGRWTLRIPASRSLPPGPPGLPWVGNVIGVNTSTPWTTYAEWGRTYGDIVYSRLLGKDIIILNSEKVAKDLLETRSRNYSSRPQFITNELCGLDSNSVFLPYGERWRLHRHFFHRTFGPEATLRFLPNQHRKACHLLQQMLDSPEQLENHVFEYTAAIIMKSTYDYDPVSSSDQLVEMVANVLGILAPVLRPDVSVIIGAFPWLLHLPSWFPGMSVKKEMKIARECSKEYFQRPFDYALQEARDIAAPSMVQDALRETDKKGTSPKQSWMSDLKMASGTAFLGTTLGTIVGVLYLFIPPDPIAASDTSNAVLMTFFLMMVMHPEVQEKAQAQIDALLGSTRLPSLDDRPFLPFIDAIFWEIFRYSPPIPLSIPHTTMEEDTYNGFHIPKDAFVMANVWAMARDEVRYPEPHAFLPERLLDDDGSLKPHDVAHIAFGFGRRICAGRHFANTSVWSVMAKALAVFKFSRPLDEDGVEIPIEPRFSNGVVVHPLPFKCRIVPRFPGMDAGKLERLIAASHA